MKMIKVAKILQIWKNINIKLQKKLLEIFILNKIQKQKNRQNKKDKNIFIIHLIDCRYITKNIFKK